MILTEALEIIGIKMLYKYYFVLMEFPGDPVVKICLPMQKMSVIPSLRRFHMPQDN